MTVRYLPPVAIEGHRPSGAGADHPMRIVTRQAAGLDPGGWTSDVRDRVHHFFDDMAAEWHTRTSPQRTAVVTDALVRGLSTITLPAGPVVEEGSGIGAYSGLLAERTGRAVLAVDLSLEMLVRAPARPAHRIQADAARLPIQDAAASAVVLINAFLFPDEIDRVLSPRGAVVWVNSSGEQTPIHLSVDDLVAALPGEWTGVWSRAGEGLWCVIRRA
jgi:ubiquinone/menaquinone biosynthesis C-methylase UbiE